MFSADDDTYTIDYQAQPPYYPEPNEFPQDDQLIRGSCNGLLCISDNNGYMTLWNPATKEDVQIPYPHFYGQSVDVVVGFGYDPVADEYKIVRSMFHFRDSKPTEFHYCKVKVRTLGTRKWRTVNDPPCRLRDRHMPPPVSGALHWLGGSPIGSSSSEHKIVSFDIHSEKFHVVPWIECVTDTGYDTTLGVLQGNLSALISYGPDLGIHIWMMKDYGVKESWSKLFSVKQPLAVTEFSTVEPLVLRENGEMILKSGGELYVYNGIDHTLDATYNIHYDPYPRYGGHVYLDSDGDDDDDLSSSCCAGHIYAESLVSILKSGGELYVYNGIDHTLDATYNICYDLGGHFYIDDLSSSCYAGHIYAESLVSIKSLVGEETEEELVDQEADEELIDQETDEDLWY